MLTSRGLGRVLGDLASMGFDARWGVLGANAVGAPHQRERIWICDSHPSGERWNDRIGDWKKRQLLRDKNWNASESKSEREGWFSWVGQVGADVANTRCELRPEGNATELDSEKEVWSTSAVHNQPSSQGQNVSNTDCTQRQRMQRTQRTEQEHSYACDSRWWETEPNVGRMADGVAAGVDRLKAIGNGQVPLCAATAWRILSENIS